MKKINQVHDKFFKATFSLPEVVREYLGTFLPPEILAKTNLNSLILDGSSYINEDLSAYYSDLVWNVSYGKTTVKIALLFEHKTQASRYIHLQLLRYMLQIWDKNIENGDDLVPIIPIVIYQGKRKWKKRNFPSLFKGIDDYLLRYLPVFDYERTDATIETEKLLQNGQNFRAAMVFRAFRQVILQLFSREDLILFFKETNFDATDSDTQRRVLSYILQNTDIDANVVWSDYILLSQNDATNMSTFDQLVALGEERGIALGEERGIALGEERGIALGEALSIEVYKLYRKGKSIADIAQKLVLTEAHIQKIITQYEED